MELLNFLSFGTWHSSVSNSDLKGIAVLFIISCTLLLIKAVINLGEFIDEIPKKHKTFLGYLIFVLALLPYIALYLLPYFVVALFSSTVILILTQCICLGILTTGGIVFIASEGSVNMLPIDKAYREFLRKNLVEPISNALISSREIGKINKKIHEYRKKSI